jgi:hypothetical protein
MLRQEGGIIITISSMFSPNPSSHLLRVSVFNIQDLAFTPITLLIFSVSLCSNFLSKKTLSLCSKMTFSPSEGI